MEGKSMRVAAFDVAKKSLEFSLDRRSGTLANEESSIVRFLERLPAGWVVAMEATGRYHRDLARLAYDRGFRVIVANPRRVHSYVGATCRRGKTDRTDAQAIALYVQSQGSELRDFVPPSPRAARIRELTRQRQTLVDVKASIAQSLGRTSPAAQAAARGLDDGVESLERELAAELGQVPEYKLLLSIPGVGPTVAAGFLGLLLTCDFATADSFVAYLGLDPRPNDSGAKTGRRYISGQGDATVRRLAYMAGMSAQRTPALKDYAQKQKDKGLPSTAVSLIVGRKIARTAWSVYKRKTPFVAERLSKPLDNET
jgi:transposase